LAKVFGALLTFTGDVRAHNPARTQTNLGRLALPRIGLFRLRDAHFQTDAFHLRPANHGGRQGPPRLLRLAATAQDLVEGCVARRGCVEGSADGNKGPTGEGIEEMGDFGVR